MYFQTYIVHNYITYVFSFFFFEVEGRERKKEEAVKNVFVYSFESVYLYSNIIGLQYFIIFI